MNWSDPIGQDASLTGWGIWSGKQALQALLTELHHLSQLIVQLTLQIRKLADRGFRRTSLLQFLGGLGLDYVIRVCGNIFATHCIMKLYRFLCIWCWGASKQKKIEPWYIATSLNDLDRRDVPRFQESLSLV